MNLISAFAKNSMERLSLKGKLLAFVHRRRKVSLLLLLAFLPILPTEHVSRESLVRGNPEWNSGPINPLNEYIYKKNGFSIFGFKGVVLQPYSLLPSIPWWFQNELSSFVDEDPALATIDLNGTGFTRKEVLLQPNIYKKHHEYVLSALEQQLGEPNLAKCIANQMSVGRLVDESYRARVIFPLIQPSPVPAIWLLRWLKTTHLMNLWTVEFRRSDLMFSKACKKHPRYNYFRLNSST